MELQLRLPQHDRAKLVPWHAVQARGTDRFGGVHIDAVVRKPEEVSGNHKREDLPVAILAMPPDTDDAGIDGIDEVSVLSFRKYGRAATPKIKDGRDGGELFLFGRREQIFQLRRPIADAV